MRSIAEISKEIEKGKKKYPTEKESLELFYMNMYFEELTVRDEQTMRMLLDISNRISKIEKALNIEEKDDKD